MPSPNSCTRCSKPAVLVSPSGLCPSCAATDETANPTPASAPQIPEEAIPTGSIPPAPDSTASAELTGSTTGAHGSAHLLPTAPAGYDLLRRLGGGGMGEVYLAREQASERLVAMKFLRHPGRPDAFERFALELRVLAKLDHPNIVRVLASDFLRADPFFTMEYVQGGTLSRAESGPVAAEKAVRLIRAVAGAVAATHAENVIHRDLKPSNILLTDDGTPKVADFGLAKRLDETDPLTIASGGLGTPGYMPPEQISRKNGPIGPWSDVYGLGATLYHLLTGRAPFVGETPQEVISHVLSDPPERPRVLCATIPPALEGIVVKCLEKDPKDRFQSVAELATELDDYAAGRKTKTPPLTRWRRAKRWAKRNRRGVLAGVVALVVLGALVAAGVWRGPSDPQDDIRAALKNGKTVQIIGPKGFPEWLGKNWLVHPAPLYRSTTADDACAFESVQPSMLAFLKDPGRDSYRVTAEFRMLRTAMADPKQQPGNAEFATSGTGLFLGYVTARGADGTEAHGCLLIEFTDYMPPDVRNMGIDAGVKPCGQMIVTAPNVDYTVYRRGWYDGTRFPPAPTLPGEWRVIRAEVRPTGVKIFWAEAPGRPLAEIGDASAESLNGNYGDFQAWLNQNRPGSAIVLSGWEPRAPFGVWGKGSAVAVRNVTIEPLN